MRLVSALLAVPAVLAVLALDVLAFEPVPGAPRPIASVTVQDLDGRPLDLKDYLSTDAVTVLNFWATWCAPCKQEMPTLAALDAIVADRSIRVVTLAMDRAGPAAIRSFMAEVGAERLAVLHDPKMAVSEPFDIRGLPMTIVVDRNGDEVFRHAGFADWSSPAVVEFLEQLLDAAA